MIVFEMLTGAPPFRGTTHERLAQHLDAEPPRPELGDDVPPHVGAVVLQCLAKDPEDRPGSAAALRSALLYPPRRRARWPWIAGPIAAAVAIGFAARPEAPQAFAPVHVDMPSLQVPAASLSALDAELPTFEVAERRAVERPIEPVPAKPRRVRRRSATPTTTFHPPQTFAAAASSEAIESVPAVSTQSIHPIQKMGGLKNPFLAGQDDVTVGYPAASPTGP